MDSVADAPSPASWPKVLLNGFLVWLAGFILYLVPGFVVAVPMGLDLGPKLRDNAEVGRQISQAVSSMYQSSLSLHYGYIVVLAVLVFWRSSVLSKRSLTRSVSRGVWIAAIPGLLTVVPFALGGHILLCAIAVVALLSAGIIGATRKTPQTSP